MTNEVLSSILEYWITLFVLGLTRVTAFIVTFPFFRFARIPQLLKISIAVFLTTIWLVNLNGERQPSMDAFQDSSWAFVGINVLREAVIGAALGFALGLIFLPARIAGSIIGQEMGLNMAALTDPNTGMTANVVAELLFAIFVLVFLWLDAHLLTFGAVFTSFDTFPVAQSHVYIPPIWLAKGINISHHWGYQLSAPVLSSLFITTILLTIIMKISPQLNLFTFGTGIRLLVGIASLFLFLPEIVMSMQRVITNLFTVAAKFGL